MQAPVSPFSISSTFPEKIPLLIVSLLGTTLEYFEYAIYGFLAPVLAPHFFPSEDPSLSLLKTFGVLAVGAIASPLGALIFGYLGDTKGRSFTLRYTMIGISVPTFIVGLLPGYEIWGWGAVVALILCRMSQGAFKAAESDGMRIYVFEHFGQKHPCLISSLISCSAYAGIALASFVGAQTPWEGEAWRWVFFASSACSIPIYMLRRHLVETPAFLRLRQSSQQPIPLKSILWAYWPSLIRTAMICGAVGGIYQFYFVFQGAYLSRVLNFVSVQSANHYIVFLMCLYVFVLPLAGWTADRWGYARVGKVGGMLTFICAVINFLVIKDGVVFLPLMALTTLSMALFVVPGYLFVTQQYDVNIRFRCFSLGHAFGSTLFSGTTPAVCLFLWKATALPYAPFIYFVFLIIMGVSAFIWRSKENAYNAWFL